MGDKTRVGRVFNPLQEPMETHRQLWRLLTQVWDRAKGGAVILGLPESPACPQQSY